MDMNRLEQIVVIMNSYNEGNGNANLVAAEHDVLYLPDTDQPISETDKKRLHKLGLFWDESLDSWCVFTH